MLFEYDNISAYLITKKTLIDRIKALEELIDLTILSLADHISGSGTTISEYQLDDGQVKIKTGYRSLTEVSNGLKNLEHIKQLYTNQLNGRSVVLRDIKSFR